MMRVVIAPDSFKGTLRAADAAIALREGWLGVRPTDDVQIAPMADGGEGTIDAIAAAVPGACLVPVTVSGPDTRPVAASWLLLPDRTGVVELASTSGIELLDTLAPLDAHTLGFGQAIAAALDHGVDRLLLAVGSSASSDGGTGLLTALGGAFLDPHGDTVRPGARGLADLSTVDLSGLHPLPPGGAVVLADVTNPLVGPRGAAAVFGPQKGATPDDIERIDAGLRRLAGRVGLSPDIPGTGAAGGVGYGLLAWGATLGLGSEEVARAIGLPESVSRADLVITGEGSFDDQSASGKAPWTVARLALDVGCPVAIVAGRIVAETDMFSASVSLSDLAGSAGQAVAEPGRWLREAGAILAGSGQLHRR